MERCWEVTLTHESTEHRDIHTFVWGGTREEAEERLKSGMVYDAWKGWTFTIGKESA